MSFSTFRLAVAMSLLAAPTLVGQETADLTVVVDVVVEDWQGRPATDLKVRDIDLRQDGVAQAVTALRPGSQPGHYELSYVPRSGKPGPVVIQVLRPRLRVRGPDGPFLKPRVVRTASPLETELEPLLDGPARNDLACHLAVLRFEARPEGLHHTLAVEVPLAGVRFVREQGLFRGRVQLLVRLRTEDGRRVHQYVLDKPIDVSSLSSVPRQRFVWTANEHLKPGGYRLEAVVRDPATAQVAVQALPFESPSLGGGLRLSPVLLLQPQLALMAREGEGRDDDPLYVDGAPVMPAFDLVLPVETDAEVWFSVTVYPDPAVKDSPPSVRLELLRDGKAVLQAPLVLPPPDARGEIHYSGKLATAAFQAGPHVLRIVARQGSAAATEETGFRMSAEPEVPRLRFEERGVPR